MDVTKYKTVYFHNLVTSSKNYKFFYSPEKLRNLKYDYSTPQRLFKYPWSNWWNHNIGCWQHKTDCANKKCV